MAQQISEKRRTAYYTGMGLMILGGILIASTFLTFAMKYGDFSNFEDHVKSQMLRSFVGMGLIIAGSFIRGIGARGLAGSGVVLDPAKAREDLEPYSRMAGGMVKDALEEAGLGQAKTPETIVKIRCQSCANLNAENANFCQKCGKPIGARNNA